jgi:hypothetical protein
MSVPALEQMGRKGVAKRMKRKRLAQPGGLRGLLEQPAEMAADMAKTALTVRRALAVGHVLTLSLARAISL